MKDAEKTDFKINELKESLNEEQSSLLNEIVELIEKRVNDLIDDIIYQLNDIAGDIVAEFISPCGTVDRLDELEEKLEKLTPFIKT